MTILLTGATGFIGRNLVRRLLDDGHSVHTLLRASSDTTHLPPAVVIHHATTHTEYDLLFTETTYDGVIHLATHFLSAHTGEDIPALIEANITFGTQLLDAATRAHVPWCITTGTFTQYDGDGNRAPANLYSATKQAFADIVHYYALASETTILTLELFNTFGEGDTRKKIFTLWNETIATGKTLDMSPGEQIMDITHVNNVVDGYVHALTLLADNPHLHNDKIYTLPSSERMALRELATVFSDVLKKPLPINFGAVPYRPNEVMQPITGTPLPGWTPRISLRDGIRRTYT